MANQASNLNRPRRPGTGNVPLADESVSMGPIQGVTDGASSVLGDAFDLAELQAQLALEDAKSFTQAARLAVVGLIVSLALLIASLPVVANGMAQGLSWGVEWPLWICQLIVGLALVGVGLLIAFSCIKRLKNAFKTFDATRHEAAENIRWLRQAVSRSFTI